VPGPDTTFDHGDQKRQLAFQGKRGTLMPRLVRLRCNYPP
jgi:hypothetical protein